MSFLGIKQEPAKVYVTGLDAEGQSTPISIVHGKGFVPNQQGGFMHEVTAGAVALNLTNAEDEATLTNLPNGSRTLPLLVVNRRQVKVLNATPLRDDDNDDVLAYHLKMGRTRITLAPGATPAYPDLQGFDIMVRK